MQAGIFWVNNNDIVGIHWVVHFILSFLLAVRATIAIRLHLFIFLLFGNVIDTQIVYKHAAIFALAFIPILVLRIDALLIKGK